MQAIFKTKIFTLSIFAIAIAPTPTSAQNKNDTIIVTGYTYSKKRYCCPNGCYGPSSKSSSSKKSSLSIKKNISKENLLIEKSISKISLFPNITAANKIINIKLNAPKQEFITILLISQDGKIIQTQKVQTIKGQQTIPFIISQNITPQMAFVKLMNAKGQWVATEKLIIQ